VLATSPMLAHAQNMLPKLPLAMGHKKTHSFRTAFGRPLINCTAAKSWR